MEFYAYPSRSLPSSSPISSFSFGNFVFKVKEYFSSSVSVILGNVFSAIFTFFFALVGTLLGAMTGALIGQETESGFVRGAAVGAISGAVFSLEVFESSLVLWQSDESGLGCLLYLIDVIVSLLNGRLVRERIGPAMLSAVQSQMGAIETSYEEVQNIFDTDGAKGLAGDSVEKIPKIRITRDNNDDASGDKVCCSVCLQMQVTKAVCPKVFCAASRKVVQIPFCGLTLTSKKHLFLPYFGVRVLFRNKGYNDISGSRRLAELNKD